MADPKLSPEIEKILKDMIKESYWRGVVYGGQYVVDTLKGAMKVSGLDTVQAMWLETATKELKQIKESNKQGN